MSSATSASKFALTFGAQTALAKGLRCEAAVRRHVVAADEPEALGGTDTAANPVELLLAALITCQAITYRVWAKKLDIELTEVHVETEGDIDLRGFFGIDDAVRPGFGAIRLRVRLDGPETPERYRELAAAVDGHCPVLDMIRSPVPMERVIVEA